MRWRSILIALAVSSMVAAPFASVQAAADMPLLVALGDSVAAGAGLPSAVDASAEDETCDRSAYAYPFYLSEAIPAYVANLACSGAKVDEGIYDRQTRRGDTIPAQLDRAFDYGQPDVITITIGANDARWTQAISDCYIGGCGSAFDRGRAAVYRADLRLELTWMLQKIAEQSSGTPPHVLLSGYYAPFPSDGCTFEITAIDADEQAWLVGQTVELNQTIQSVLSYFSFAHYVPLDFTDHDLCSETSWLQGRSDTAPFHPTIEGQQAIARAFLSAL